MKTISTQNEAWGFFGTIGSAHPDLQAEAWDLAVSSLSENTGHDIEYVRNWLDSADGRHFADDVHNEIFSGKDLKVAMSAAITRWNGFRIGNKARRAYDVPADATYLAFKIMLIGSLNADLA